MSTEPGTPAVPPFGETARAGDDPSPAGDGGADTSGVTVEPDPAAVPRPVTPTPPDADVPSEENPPGVEDVATDEAVATDEVVALDEVGTDPEVGPTDEVTSLRVADAPNLDPATVHGPEPALDLDAVAADLDSVEAALTRLDDGSYGRCAGCGDEIDDHTLAADPTAMACSAHLPAIAG